jgi:hypothetical protein
MRLFSRAPVAHSLTQATEKKFLRGHDFVIWRTQFAQPAELHATPTGFMHTYVQGVRDHIFNWTTSHFTTYHIGFANI